MDESMTPTSLDQFWSSWCNKCNEQKETSKRPQDQDCDPHDVSEVTPTDSQYQHKPGAVYQTKPEFHFIPPAHSGQMIPPHPADDSVRDQAQLYEWDRAGNKRTGFAGALSRSRDPSVEEAECLEPPLPLMSDAIAFHPGQYPAAGILSGFDVFTCDTADDHHICDKEVLKVVSIKSALPQYC